jgi:agmatine deiminase
MIPDVQTNTLYLSGLLPSRFPGFFSNFKKAVNQLQIPYHLLEGTNDIWAVDYMPIQVHEQHFVQFLYRPDYLRNSVKGRKSITEARQLCKAMNLHYASSQLLVDGGNVIATSDKVILCDKVLRENPSFTELEIRKQLVALFETDQVLFIPTDPCDPVGHADGRVRFVDANTVLVNDYDDSDEDLKQQLQLVLKQAGLEVISLPYNPYNNKGKWDAAGIYMNYLHMEQGILVPVFNQKEDEAAVRVLEEVFSGQPIVTVDSRDLAREGGILNCISWNIFQ